MATPTVESLRVYLGAGESQWEDAELAEVLLVETAAQAARCTINPATPDEPDLEEALRRRCARNLAMRKLPVGIQSGETESLRVGATDPEIQRLEAPYRKRVVG